MKKYILLSSFTFVRPSSIRVRFAHIRITVVQNNSNKEHKSKFNIIYRM